MKFQILDIFVRYHTRGELRTFIRLIGRNEQGERVCVDVNGLPWYVYVDRWNSAWSDEINKRMVGAVKRFRQCKCIVCAGVKTGRNEPCKNDQKGLLDTVIIKHEPVLKKSFCGYSPAPKMYQKLYLTHPFFMRPITWTSESVLEGERLNFYESDISPEVRFCTDLEITPCGWVEVDGDRVNSNLRVAHHLKVDLKKNNHKIIPLNDSKNSPIVTLAWDIECTCLTGEERFPIASKDPVITIGCVKSVYGKPELTEKTVFQLGTCDPIEGTTVVACPNEQSLLIQFCEYFIKTGPDVFSGYNSDFFDFVYVFDRMEKLKLKHMQFISVEPNREVFFKKGTSCSAQSGARETIQIIIPGTIPFDLLPICRMNYKLRSYKLNDVAQHFLKDQKKDEMAYENLPVFQKRDSKHRALIARYCVQDTVLVQNLCEKLQLLTNAIAMARVCGVTLFSVITRGQSFKTKCMVLQETSKAGFIFPVFKRDPTSGHTMCSWHTGIVNEQEFESGQGKTGFRGATVLEPVVGLHKEPVAVLDFASLYPSIMMAFNLSQDTMIQSYKEAERMGLSRDDVNESPNGFLFANKEKGILPIILKRLLIERKQEKKRMKEAPNEFDRAVHNGQQLALKIACNSIYGWCGASFGSVPAPNIASSVTSYGRVMIEDTANYGKQHYGAEIIYGDTDSVFVKFPKVDGETPLESRQRTLRLAQEMEQKINFDGTFKAPNFLEYEVSVLSKCPRYFASLCL